MVLNLNGMGCLLPGDMKGEDSFGLLLQILQLLRAFLDTLFEFWYGLFSTIFTAASQSTQHPL